MVFGCLKNGLNAILEVTAAADTHSEVLLHIFPQKAIEQGGQSDLSVQLEFMSQQGISFQYFLHRADF